VRQMYVHGLLTKEIETYSTLKITNVGCAFMKNPTTFEIVKEEEIGEVDDDELIIPKQGGGAVDEVLFGLLKELHAKMGYNSTTRPRRWNISVCQQGQNYLQGIMQSMQMPFCFHLD
jgi:ATP-dependent DNA helicase RecQ